MTIICKSCGNPILEHYIDTLDNETVIHNVDQFICVEFDYSSKPFTDLFQLVENNCNHDRWNNTACDCIICLKCGYSHKTCKDHQEQPETTCKHDWEYYADIYFVKSVEIRNHHIICANCGEDRFINEKED